MNNFDEVRLLKYYTGPVGVKEWADLFREAGLKVEVEGTEHVYVVNPGGGTEQVRMLLVVQHGRSFGF